MYQNRVKVLFIMGFMAFNACFTVMETLQYCNHNLPFGAELVCYILNFDIDSR